MWSSTNACGREARAGQRPGVADALQLVAEPGAVDGRRCRGPPRAPCPPTNTSDPSMSGAKRAPSSSVKKATASGRAGLDAGLLERLDHLEPGQHAVVAVVAATGADGVDVRSGHHGAPSPTSHRPTTLPMASTETDRSRSRIQATTRSRPAPVVVGQGQPAAARRRRCRRSAANSSSRPARRA